MSAATWLDDYFRKAITAIQWLGNLLPNRPAVDFEGSGVVVADDPTNNRTVVTIAGAGVGGPRTVLTVTHGNTGAVTGPTDDVYIDATGGGATVKLTAAPVLGEWHRITCTNGTPVVDGNGNNVGSWAPSNQAFQSTTTITQVGQGGTVQWNGSDWWWV